MTAISCRRMEPTVALPAKTTAQAELPATDITFTNCSFQSTIGFLVQDAKDIVFDNVTITTAIGEGLGLDNASVKWNGAAKSGTSGGPAEKFY
jgi:hypothetical protein